MGRANVPVFQVNDGVAFGVHGDVITSVYNAPARLQRSRWLYDRADLAVRGDPGDGFLVFMVILPTSSPPDAETRAENAARMRSLAGHFRRFVTVAIGDTFQATVVRTAMRAISVLQGRSRIHRVFDDVEGGLTCLLEARRERTPLRAEIDAMLRDMYRALGAGESLQGAHGPMPR
ncbi:MAG TPA: hypothetical protein VKU41_19150 [Polyangiaceae bacterium]|nr:hypothetical protein [Polyangiaceae bacterium]